MMHIIINNTKFAMYYSIVGGDDNFDKIIEMLEKANADGAMDTYF